MQHVLFSPRPGLEYADHPLADHVNARTFVVFAEDRLAFAELGQPGHRRQPLEAFRRDGRK